jgi:hypothetical protein
MLLRPSRNQQSRGKQKQEPVAGAPPLAFRKDAAPKFVLPRQGYTTRQQ